MTLSLEEIVGTYMFACSSRKGITICPKLGMLLPQNQEETLERSILRKRVLDSSPGKGGFCS
jgi:hypothetical protein